MADFSNKTEFAIKSDAERYTWAVFHIFILLSSLVGDALILIAAIKDWRTESLTD